MAEVDMPRKWEFITEWCQKHGYDELADIAYEIDQLLVQLYDRKVTDEWIEVYSEAGFAYIDSLLNLLFDVVTESDYCVACFESYDCSDCLFGLADGDKIFSEFCKLLASIMRDDYTS